MPQNPTAAAALVRDPLLFMQNNLVFVQFNALSGIHSLTLNDDNTVGRLPDGSGIPCYWLARGDGANGSFDAFWCSYAGNEARYVTVGPPLNLMFTAAMDGCSLGVGSVVHGGRRLVSHANCAAIGEVICDSVQQRGFATQVLIAGNQQRDPEHVRHLVARSHQQYAQRLAIQQTHGNDQNVTLIEPSTYARDPVGGAESLMSITFGIRDDQRNEWAFYTQQQRHTAHDSTLVALTFVGGDRPPPQQQPAQQPAQQGGFLTWLFGS